MTLLWSLVLASVVATYALARADAGRLTDRQLLALGRSWFGGRRGLGRLGWMVRWSARAGMALFVASLVVTGGGEFARELDQIRVRAEAHKQSEAVLLRGLAGAVGAQRQGGEDDGHGERDDGLPWWEDECAEEDEGEVPPKGEEAGGGTDELCDALGMPDLIARAATAFEQGFAQGLMPRPPADADRAGERDPEAERRARYEDRVALVRHAVLRAEAAGAAGRGPVRDLGTIAGWPEADRRAVAEQGVARLRDGLRRGTPLSGVGRQFERELASVLGALSAEGRREAVGRLRRVLEVPEAGRHWRQLLVATLGVPADFGFAAAGAPDRVEVALAKEIAVRIPNSAGAYRRAADALMDRLAGGGAMGPLAEEVAAHVAERPVLPYDDRLAFRRTGQAIWSGIGPARFRDAVARLGSSRPAASRYERDFPSGTRSRRQKGFGREEEFSYSHSRQHGHSGVGGVLFGKPPSDGDAEVRDLAWEWVEGRGIVLTVVLDAAEVRLGPAPREMLATALAYAADGRPTAVTILAAEAGASRVTVHPALEDTAMGCRLVELDRLTFRWLDRDPEMRARVDRAAAEARQEIEDRGEEAVLVSGVRERPYRLDAGGAFLNEAGLDFHVLLSVDMRERTEAWDRPPLLQGDVDRLVSAGFAASAEAGTLRREVRLFVQLQRLFGQALEGRLGTSFPVERLAALAGAANAAEPPKAATPRWIVPDRDDAVAGRRERLLGQLASTMPVVSGTGTAEVQPWSGRLATALEECAEAVRGPDGPWWRGWAGSGACRSLCVGARASRRFGTDQAVLERIEEGICAEFGVAGEMHAAVEKAEALACDPLGI